MHIAVVGTGVSGNLAARLLHSAHTVDVFESAGHIGGHAHSVDVEAYGRSVCVDVAFMVFNRRTYPNLCRLLNLLAVPYQASDMSLSVRCSQTGLEYQGSSLNGLFAQRSNVLRPAFHGMLVDILRFNKCARQFCDDGDDQLLLGDFLDQIGLRDSFRNHYLVPMSAAIWSAKPSEIAHFPATFILGFMRNHGLLQVRRRPQWLTLADRSRSYVAALVRPFRERVRLNCPVQRVDRMNNQVRLTLADGSTQYFDHVVLATHADQSLAMLADASETEKEVLGGFPYQSNDAVLHTDASVLPKRRRAWASWNYHIPAGNQDRVCVTYDLNRLQSLGLPGPLCLTVNPSCEINERKVLARFQFQHPVFSSQSLISQNLYDEINGQGSISFCGAYWGYGFHEDGINSGLAVGKQFGLNLDSLASSSRQADNAAHQPESESTPVGWS